MGWGRSCPMVRSHVSRGLWRTTALSDYRSQEPNWRTLLDLDRLAEQEREDWVFKGASCFPPRSLFKKCLLELSRGGKDAAVRREFDMESKQFTGDFPLHKGISQSARGSSPRNGKPRSSL